jgi:Uma2 family endonuclease
MGARKTFHVGHGPFRADQLPPNSRYELSDGHPIQCAPAGGRHANAHERGARSVATDPIVKESGIDAGYSPDAGTLRAPDVSVGHVPDKPGWVKGAPPLAIEYADTGQDEADLRLKVSELLRAGTRYVWVVRLTGVRRVEVHTPDRPMRTLLPGSYLEAPGILKNRVLVEALYDETAANEAALTNLVQRKGYDSFEAALAASEEKGKIEGKIEGKQEGKQEGREEGRAEAKADALLKLVASRGWTLTTRQHARIRECRDVERLDRWFERALIAKRLSQIWR